VRVQVAALAVALTAGAAMLVPVPGAASDIGPGCGIGPDPEPVSEHACKFLFRGFPLRVTATASDPTGNSRTMTLRVWMHEYYDHQHLGPIVGHETTLITECTSTGSGFVACQEDWPTGDEVDLIHPLLTQQVHLACHVEADIAGTTTRPRITYSCNSGRGF